MNEKQNLINSILNLLESESPYMLESKSMKLLKSGMYKLNKNEINGFYMVIKSCFKMIRYKKNSEIFRLIMLLEAKNEKEM